MRVAFYAPLKPPDHPVPSGDRRMARAFMALLGDLGHEVRLASRLRSFDSTGDRERQERVRDLGRRLVERIAAGTPRPDLWLTYHVYHKSPDWLGPAVSDRLGIPYVIAEGSQSARQATGSWATGHAGAAAALARADLVLAMTRKDLAGLEITVDSGRLRLFPPFIDAAPFRAARVGRDRSRAALAARLGLDPGRTWLLTVAMMRADAKARSYEVLAQALHRLRDPRWQLVVVGDGPARPEVERLLAPFGPDRVRLTGALPFAELPAVYAACDLFVWPACNEAYGLVLLEAQAAGLPVLAGAEGGVPDIVRDGVTGRLTLPRDPAAFAATLDELLGDPASCRRLGDEGAASVARAHDRPMAAARLAALLQEVLPGQARPSFVAEGRCAFA